MPSSNTEPLNVKKAIEKYEMIQGEKMVRSEENIEILQILETFLKRKGLMCYGGLALNNILPKEDQFYESYEMPDYDVYSSKPIKDVTELADIYYKHGYTNCTASANPIHEGSYKLFVNYMGILDLTYVPPILFDRLTADRIIIDGISYTPVNFLRRSVYNELSNPEGDVSRFDKVYTRLQIVDKYYPVPPASKYQSSLDNLKSFNISNSAYTFLVNNIVQYGGVFFGGYALQSYAKYMDPDMSRFLQTNKQPIYAFAKEPKLLIDMIKSSGEKENILVETIKHPAVGDIVNVHYEIILDRKSVGVIFEPIGCHSYNTIRRNKQYVKIATIYTILHMYYSFIYLEAPYYNNSFLNFIVICLYNIKHTNATSGVLQPFPITCYGTQHTKEDILSNRADLYSELKNNPDDTKLNKYFFKYYPNDVNKGASTEPSSSKYAALDNIQSDTKPKQKSERSGPSFTKTPKNPKTPQTSDSYFKPGSTRRNQHTPLTDIIHAGVYNTTKFFSDRFEPYKGNKTPRRKYRKTPYPTTKKQSKTPYSKGTRNYRSVPNTGIFGVYNKQG
jgi:hypothetical protein